MPTITDAPTPRALLVRFTFDGIAMRAASGQTVAAALLATGRRSLRRSSRRSAPRGFFCGMGVCFECVMQIDGRPNVRACVTPVTEGMRVETQRGWGSWA